MTSSNGNIFRVTGHLCGEFTGWFPTQRPVTRSFDVFFDLRLNKCLSKQSWRWWFETLSCPLWRHCNDQQKSNGWKLLYLHLMQTWWQCSHTCPSALMLLWPVGGSSQRKSRGLENNSHPIFKIARIDHLIMADIIGITILLLHLYVTPLKLIWRSATELNVTLKWVTDIWRHDRVNAES